MKFFVDTANVASIREAYSWGIVDGVTTNPTLVAKEGRDFKETILEICNIVNGPVSAEVVSLDTEGMVKEALEISDWHPNIVIKIPMTKDGMAAVRRLTKEGIKTNVTLVFSASQALIAAKAGATYISVFVGRLDDAGHNGLDVVFDTVQMIDNYDFDSEVIVASVRHPLHVVKSAQMGAHIATVPFPVLDSMFKHPMTDIGIERFLKDWEKVPK
ncbi:MAG TPA: fructose-6-phosphate aldolase [Armatimonadota bacterium]|jgi:transaldolase|nr:fructose-6-phosphate aldolase [Armatimonadota bacterium]HOM72916.1 fructose-6-phosphate aldolase [Armatimonadota bacterium]HOP80988.1 fructose-6-phosphate aldolase [Armatimonadota bacterium]HPP75515.1 fructose-6-phosphate aldolase [Armatimonadota bacterium]